MPVYRVTCTCIVQGQTCQNVFHLASDGGQLLSAIAGAVNQAWISQMLPFQHNGARWVNIEVREATTPLNAPFSLAIDVLGTGAAVQVADDPCRCRVLKFRTALAGRSGRGRLYIPGTSMSAWNGNFVNSASLSAGNSLINTLKTNWLAPNATQQLALVICPRSNPGNFKTVTDIIQRPLAGYQRRRNIGIGI